MVQPLSMHIGDPTPLLQWIARQEVFDLSAVKVPSIWGLTALAAQCRNEQPRLRIERSDPSSAASRFAHAVGFESACAGTFHRVADQSRTCAIERIKMLSSLDPQPVAERIARLILPSEEEEETRRTFVYVLVELIRNVSQHSRDPLGGIVAAQRMDAGSGGYRKDHVQVAVADAGIGILEALRGFHPTLANAKEACEKALWPHYSGTFEEGLTGTAENAGLGLFFIAEMTKLTGGRLLLATRGATLSLVSDDESTERNHIQFLDQAGPGYPGTIVAFEAPFDSVADYYAIIETIQQRAQTRAPGRTSHRWLRYDEPDPTAFGLSVRIAAESTPKAVELAAKALVPKLAAKQALKLDFTGIEIFTQSFAHALLYEPLRVAWALKTPIWIVNAKPSVRSTLALLERYALSG